MFILCDSVSNNNISDNCCAECDKNHKGKGSYRSKSDRIEVNLTNRHLRKKTLFKLQDVGL